MLIDRRQPGWLYPWIFVGGMLLVVAVNAVLIVSAIATFPGLQTEDHYRKGLEYNRTLAEARAQVERGWQMALAFTAADAAADDRHRGELTTTFTDKQGRPLDDLEVDAALVRPTNQGFDVAVHLQHRGAGVYAGALSLPLPGQWEARILARRDADAFQTSRRLFVP